MAKNDLGEIRRGQIITTYGPGSVVDLVIGKTSKQVSVIMSGIDQWDTDAPKSSATGDEPQLITEDRLQQLLNVDYFRAPPVLDESAIPPGKDRLIGIRFPEILICPKCRVLKYANDWAGSSRDPNSPDRYCDNCGDEPILVGPPRFIQVCEQGCISDFPWKWWAHAGGKCAAEADGAKKPSPGVKLEVTGGGLAGLRAKCMHCGKSQSMKNALKRAAFGGHKCSGNQPWLGGGRDDRKSNCTGSPRAVYRGGSNVHFPVIRSAVSIPPWHDRLREAFPTNLWKSLNDAESEEKALILIEMIMPHNPRLKALQLTPAEIVEKLNTRKELTKNISASRFRHDEYRAFLDGAHEPSQEFELAPQNVPEALQSYLNRVIEVKRLREVRAMIGFTRLIPPDEQGSTRAPLTVKSNPRWYPATEVKGEGIFLELRNDKLEKWANTYWDRIEACGGKKPTIPNVTTPDGVEFECTPRFLLIHSLAHALLKSLVLESGYASASLGERVYSSDEEGSEMSGILIYTAAGDADGTLGGLCRQAHPERFVQAFTNAIQSMAWCSNDPLCTQERMSELEPKNLAACHSCLMVPENSCEFFNHYLDRRTLVGTPKDRGLGFFSDLL